MRKVLAIYAIGLVALGANALPLPDVRWVIEHDVHAPRAPAQSDSGEIKAPRTLDMDQ